MRLRSLTLTLALLAVLLLAAPAVASAANLTDPVDHWLPSSDDATWTYQWSNSAYAPVPTKEQYKLKVRNGTSFLLNWTTGGLGNPEGTVPSAGEMEFNRTEIGLVNAGWQSTPPPPQFPILCAEVSKCGNSLAGTFFMVIWGSRSPVLQEPLLQGSTWSSLGGSASDVSSFNRYVGQERVVVPAFPEGVTAAKVQSEVTQGGAIGDPFGSGVRTTWWVRGVGVVRVQFKHTGGETSQSELIQTNLAPRPAPSDVNYLPLERGRSATFRWRNSKHMRRASTQKFTVAGVSSNTARVDVKSLSGPIRVAGSYVLATRLSGVTSVAASTQAASRADFPPLGPRSQPRNRRRHFFTPYDLMTYGFNPVLPAFPNAGDQWTSTRGSRDFTVFGVTGTTRVRGITRVRTPAGTFRALLVESKLSQRGFRFGSGTRLSWFAPGKGLVKLRFRHGDGSVSTVERVR